MAGPQAGRVTATAAGSLVDERLAVADQLGHAGTTYTARGSIRSETPGKTVCLRLREWNADAVVGSAQQLRDHHRHPGVSSRRCSTRPLQSGSELDLLRLPDRPRRPRATASTSTASRSATARRRSAAHAREPRATRSCSPPATWPPAGRAATSPCRGCSTRCPGTIAIPGDTEQNHGYADEFEGCFDPSWGRHKARTKPAVGDHEYSTGRGAPGYFDYFGSAAGERGKGWYSYDLGAWHIVVLNSNCDERGRLRARLRAVRVAAAGPRRRNAGSCVGAYCAPPALQRRRRARQPDRTGPALLGAPLPAPRGMGARRQRPQLSALRAPDPRPASWTANGHTPVRGGRGRHDALRRSAHRCRTPRCRTRAPSGCSS